MNITGLIYAAMFFAACVFIPAYAAFLVVMFSFAWFCTRNTKKRSRTKYVPVPPTPWWKLIAYGVVGVLPVYALMIFG